MEQPVRRPAGDVLAIQPDLAGIRREQPGDDVEQGRLAGAVRADQAGDRAARDLKRAIIHRVDAAETLADMLDLDHALRAARRAPHSRIAYTRAAGR